MRSAKRVQAVFDGWESWRMEPEQLTPVGDQVAVVVSYRARGRSSGVEVRGQESALFTLRAGKIVRYEWFHEPHDAYDAAMRRA
jgi:ketosteroid isomerase-like protein